MKKVNWGIIGAGWIAARFAEDLKLLPQANLMAVASRSLERAEKFGLNCGSTVDTLQYSTITLKEPYSYPFCPTELFGSF